MSKLAFVHGWAEGAWSSSRLAKAFTESGFNLVNSANQADIIISHSAGCYMTAGYPNAKLIVLLGLPLWPGKPIPVSLAQKLALEIVQHRRGEIRWFANKLAHNIWYIAINPISVFVFLINKWRRQLPTPGPSQRVLLVRNQQDRFSSQDACRKLAKKRGYKFIEMPGLHDDCWIYPDEYIKLVGKYAN